MRTSIESIEKIEQAKRALGSILNLIRYQPVATLDEATARLRLLDEFAVVAFLALSDVENAEFPSSEHPDAVPDPAIYRQRPFSDAPRDLGMRP